MLFKLTLILEVVFWVLGLWFIAMQIILPAVRGTPFFPILRSAPRSAELKLAEAHEAAQVATIIEAAESVAPKSAKKGRGK